MRVLDTVIGKFVEIDPKNEQVHWPYAIFSHTWDSTGEQTYRQLRAIQKRHGLSHDDDDDDMANSSMSVKVPLPVPTSGEQLSPFWTDPRLSPKIREACRVARENGYRYLWIDSCCIDKTSSSELSESINSMYKWYARADVCYAFLPDVLAKQDHEAKGSPFRRSRWFRRGWTLQELIAPRDLVFLAEDWTMIGSKLTLGDLVADVTKIDYDALLHFEPLDKFSIAQRLSWAADRKTTRVEDRAYSLFGIFDINMPTLYGEGERAFRRLQEEIMRRTPDQSLFAWTREGLPDPSSVLLDYSKMTDSSKRYGNRLALYGDRTLPSLFAPSLDNFSKCAGIEALSHDEVVGRLQLSPDTNGLPTTDYDFTPYGIRLQLPIIPLSSSNYFPPECVDEQRINIPLSQFYLVILGCGHRDFPGHLLGRVCYTQSSGSSLIESLCSGHIFIWTRRINVKSEDFDILPVSPATITHIKSHISSKTLYIPQPHRDLAEANKAYYWKPHQTINLVLSKKTREALSAQEYAATLRGPDDAHPTAHLVTLVHNTHTVTIHYQHTLAEHQGRQQWAIEAHVKTSGPTIRICQDAPGDHLDVPQTDGHGTQVSWTDHTPWYDELEVKDVELIVPGRMVLTVQLGLTFATRNHYLLHIVLRTPANLSSHSANRLPRLIRSLRTSRRVVGALHRYLSHIVKPNRGAVASIPVTS